LKNCSRQSRDETSRKYSIGGVITKRSTYIIRVIDQKNMYNKLGSSSSISMDVEGIEWNRLNRGRRVSVVWSLGNSVDEWWSINSWTQLLSDFIVQRII
jgi:hypothetical protein